MNTLTIENSIDELQASLQTFTNELYFLLHVIIYQGTADFQLRPRKGVAVQEEYLGYY
jgi:hypothetical protein